MTRLGRLSEEPLTREERQALEAGRSLAPSAPLCERVFSAVSAAAVAGASSTAAAAGQASTGGSSGLAGTGATKSAIFGLSSAWLKALALPLATGALLGAGGYGLHEVFSSDGARASGPGAPPKVQEPAAATPAQPTLGVRQLAASSATEAQGLSVPERHAPEVRSTAAAGTAGALRRSGEPRAAAPSTDESKLVIRARSLLQSGDAAGALRMLETAQRLHPDGILVQERRALEVQALAESGHHRAAATQANEFLRAHPESPHAAGMRRFAGEPDAGP